MKGIRRAVRSLKPETMSIVGFAGLILIGTALLSLPWSSRKGPLEITDALFTATSATCVTGLVVVDTGSDLSTFGQLVVLGLIQVGGLGIMAVSTLVILLAGMRPGISGRLIVRDTYTHGRERSLREFLRGMVVFTLISEALGSICLFVGFLPGRQVLQAAYLSVFHSISAFCNAGFSLFSTNLEGFRQNWIVNLTVCCLIVLGGLGFLVVNELKGRLFPGRRTPTRVSLHTKLVISTTGALIIVGAVLILLMEWNNVLQQLDVPQRFLAALFQSITSRTAGFNTLSIGNLANETILVLLMLMFIGASPGSCGGGIKTTTFASLVLLGVARLRGRTQAQIFHRGISQEGIGRAVGLVMVSFVVICCALLALLMTELGELSRMETRGRFLELLFEVVSAFGTVGLSMGATAKLSSIGKLIISLVMFVGRLGPLAIGASMSRIRAPRFSYAEEGIMVG